MVEQTEAHATSDQISEDQIDAALEYAHSHAPLPAAQHVYFLRDSRILLIELKSTQRIAIPVEDIEDLANASDEQLAVFVIEGSGGSIHFPLFDGNLYVPALVTGIRGSQEWMAGLPERWAASLLAAA